ncbi:MAG: SLC13 family permease [archaeon]
MDDSYRYMLMGLFAIAAALLTWAGGLSALQSIAIVIIVLFKSATFLFWKRKLSFGFIAIALLLIFRVLDVDHLIRYSGLDIVIFLISMMIVVGYLERNHFFEFIIGRLIQRIGSRGNLLVFVMLLLAAATAALINEITSILIMTAIVIHLASEYKVNPVPFVLMTVFATNIGSSASVIGNPAGVIIALKGGLSSADFLRWAAPVSLVSLLAAIGVMFLMFRKEIDKFGQSVRENYSSGESELVERHRLIAPLVLFSAVIVALMLHSWIEQVMGLEKNTMLIGVASIGAGAAMLLSRHEAADLVERRVDWWTMMYFMFLFAAVGSLEYTGIIDILSAKMGAIGAGSLAMTSVVVLVAGGLMSAVLDNVLAVSVMVPIVENLRSAAPELGYPLWWVLLFAVTFFGNLTFVGSTANIVALGILHKRQWGHIGFWQWLKPGFVITLVTSAIAFGMLAVQYPLMSGG